MSNIDYKIKKYRYKLNHTNISDKEYLYRYKIDQYGKKTNGSFNMRGGARGGATEDDYNLLAYAYNMTGNETIKNVLTEVTNQLDPNTPKMSPEETKNFEDKMIEFEKADIESLLDQKLKIPKNEIPDLLNSIAAQKKVSDAVPYLKPSGIAEEKKGNIETVEKLETVEKVEKKPDLPIPENAKINEPKKPLPPIPVNAEANQANLQPQVITKILNKDDKTKEELEKQSKENSEKLVKLFANIQEFINKLKEKGCSDTNTLGQVETQVQVIREIIGNVYPKIQGFNLELDWNCDNEGESAQALNLFFKTNVKEPLNEFNSDNQKFVDSFNGYIDEQNKNLEEQIQK